MRNRLPTAAIGILAPVLGMAAVSGAREEALKYYNEAVAEREQVEALPEEQRSAAAYRKLIEAFRRVYTVSPQSSKADDSVLAMGELYAQMGRLFDAAHNQKAAWAYRFLVRQYPASPLGEQARKALEALETAPAEGEPAGRKPSRLPLVTGVRHWSAPGSTRVIVELESEVSPRYGGRLSDPERVFFDLPNTRLSAELKGRSFTVDDDLVQQVRIAQTQIGVTRVVVDLAGNVEHAISTLANPPRVVVELGKKLVSAPPAPAAPAAKPVARVLPPPPVLKDLPAPKAALPDSRGQRNLIRTLGLKVGRVVIDPGHGGHDTGTVGPAGLMEKDLCLDIAFRVGEMLRERTASEVVFTRQDDSFVALEGRTALANEKQADLFLSIHANSSRLRSARGVETYYLNLTGDREALEVAARENAAAQKSIHELGDLVSRITLTEKVAESREFAGQVQKSLHAALVRENAALRNRGVRRAPFVVLIGARMPSVLAEISFLSNSRDEKLLRAPAYRQKIAEALYNGLVTYARSLSEVEVAAK